MISRANLGGAGLLCFGAFAATFGMSVRAAQPAAIDSASVLFSNSFTLSGQCTGGDMVHRWSINGHLGGNGAAPLPNEYGSSFVYPWRNSDIVIRGVEVVVLAPVGLTSLIFGPAYFGWLFVGNAAADEIILSMGSDTTHGVNMFPGNSGIIFPGRMNMTPSTYINLHAACRWPRQVRILLTLYYSAADEEPNR